MHRIFDDIFFYVLVLTLVVLNSTNQTFANDFDLSLNSQMTISSKNMTPSECLQYRGRYYAQKKWCSSANRERCGGAKNPYISTKYCYRYVKLILQDCGITPIYLAGAHAKDAGPQLIAAGFKKAKTLDPLSAPVPSIIVYSNHCSDSHPSGHIELKTGNKEYISDYIASVPRSRVTTCRRVSGIYL